MTSFWQEPDFDAHEHVELVHDRESGLTAIIALHSTHLGPAAGGTRYWQYADGADAMRDALRLSRGMSYKNAMADLPMGGGKAVILADSGMGKTRAMLEAYGRAVDALSGRYVTAQDVGISETDIQAIAQRTSYISGLPAQGAGEAGGNPGPYTAQGIYLGIKAAVRCHLGKKSLQGVHIALQGTGSVGSRLAHLLGAEGARLSLSDINEAAARKLAETLNGEYVPAEAIMDTACDVFSPNALGAILDEGGIARLNAPIVAGGANNQLATRESGAILAQRGIMLAPDYVINAGGIISVAMEYVARSQGTRNAMEAVQEKIAKIPERLEEIWRISKLEGKSADQVADDMAQTRIGR